MEKKKASGNLGDKATVLCGRNKRLLTAEVESRRGGWDCGRPGGEKKKLFKRGERKKEGIANRAPRRE